MIAIDQSPIGRTPRSNPATYIKVFDEIRRLYTQLPEAKATRLQAGPLQLQRQRRPLRGLRGQRLDEAGDGFPGRRVGHLPGVRGPSLQPRDAASPLQGQVDRRRAGDGRAGGPGAFREHSRRSATSCKRCTTWGWITSSSASRRRRSPAARPSGSSWPASWSRRAPAGRSICSTSRRPACTSPTSKCCLKVLHDFVEAGNTVLVVEHNLDVIKTADWIIDLGPEGGAGGGRIVAAGTPEQVAERTGVVHRASADSDGWQVCRADMRARRIWQRIAKHGVQASPARRTGHVHQGPRRPAAQSQGHRRRNSPRPDDRLLRAQRHRARARWPWTRSTPKGSGATSKASAPTPGSSSARCRSRKVDHIEGLSPAIAIEQKHAGHTPRSTVGTVTEIYDYLRILMARGSASRIARPATCRSARRRPTRSSTRSWPQPAGTQLYLMAPLEIEVGEKYETLLGRDPRGRLRPHARRRPDATRSTSRRRSTAAASTRRSGHRPRDVRARRPQPRSPAAWRTPWPWAAACCTWPIRATTCPSRTGRSKSTASTLPATGAGGASSRSRRTIFRSTALGWCPACEGLGMQTGTNPAALLRDPKLTLARGRGRLVARSVAAGSSPRCSTASARATGIPLDVPFEQLGGKHRRLIMHGTGESGST